MKKRILIASLFILAPLVYMACMRHEGVVSSATPPPHVPTPNVQSQPPSRDTARRPHATSGIFFLEPRRGWVLTGRGLYGTADFGKTWTLLNREDLSFQKFVFVSQDVGWGYVDGWSSESRLSSVMRTRDGGRTWHKVLEIGTPIYGIELLNERVGYVTGRWHPIQYTNDGGETWQDVRGLEFLNRVYFLDEDRGWGYGGGIWQTVDGGKSWTVMLPPDAIKGELYDACIISDMLGFAVGSGGQVWRMSDGRTWQMVTNLPVQAEAFNDVEFVSGSEGWISGWASSTDKKDAEEGVVLHSSDRGDTWHVLVRWPGGIGDLHFVTPQEGWALDGKGRFLHTSDGGRSWSAKVLR